MAVSDIDQRILGRLAHETGPSNALLSASLFQVLGLSILLSRKLFRARKLRRLDTSRDTKSLSLYHHIIWLAREGLSITEVYVLPYCQDGEQGAECRVIAAKLRASFYHVFCLFHNHPPVGRLSVRSFESIPSTSGPLTPRADNGQMRQSPRRTSAPGDDVNTRDKKAALRDAIPSMISEASYITNPYAAGAVPTPPPGGPPPPLPVEARRTPTRPPGLAPINITPVVASASFLLPPLNFVPMAAEHFQTAQQLSNTLLGASNALRLSVCLEHAAFLWDCAREHEKSRRLARRAIKDVYESTEGLSDEEFAEASALVQALGGIVRRGASNSTPKPSSAQLASPTQRTTRTPPAATSINASPTKRARTERQDQTVPAVFSSGRSTNVHQAPEASEQRTSTPSPPMRLRSTSRQRRKSSTASDKATKRRIAEQAEDLYRHNSASNRSNVSSVGSRQATPPEGYVAKRPPGNGQLRTGAG